VHPQHLSDHLSRLVESAVNDLVTSKCVALDEETNDLAAQNLGMIAAFYYLRYTTVEVFAHSLTARTKLRGLLEILCAATEYDSLLIRHQEENVLRKVGPPGAPRRAAGRAIACCHRRV